MGFYFFRSGYQFKALGFSQERKPKEQKMISSLESKMSRTHYVLLFLLSGLLALFFLFLAGNPLLTFLQSLELLPAIKTHELYTKTFMYLAFLLTFVLLIGLSYVFKQLKMAQSQLRSLKKRLEDQHNNPKAFYRHYLSEQASLEKKEQSFKTKMEHDYKKMNSLIESVRQREQGQTKYLQSAAELQEFLGQFQKDIQGLQKDSPFPEVFENVAVFLEEIGEYIRSIGDCLFNIQVMSFDMSTIMAKHGQAMEAPLEISRQLESQVQKVETYLNNLHCNIKEGVTEFYSIKETLKKDHQIEQKNVQNLSQSLSVGLTKLDRIRQNSKWAGPNSPEELKPLIPNPPTRSSAVFHKDIEDFLRNHLKNTVSLLENEEKQETLEEEEKLVLKQNKKAFESVSPGHISSHLFDLRTS